MGNTSTQTKNSEDIDLINKVKELSDNDAILKLIDKYQKIAFTVFAKYCKKYDRLKYEELVKDVPTLISEAVMKYDESRKCKLGTFIYNSARFYCLNYHKTDNPLLDYTDKIKDLDRTIDFSYPNSDIYQTVNRILSALPDQRIKEIFRFRYLDYINKKDRTWRAISLKVNLSSTWTKILHERGKKEIIKHWK